MKHLQNGFSLIELLMVVGLIAPVLMLCSYYYLNISHRYQEHHQLTERVEQQKRAVAYFERDVRSSHRFLPVYRGYQASSRGLILQKSNGGVVIYTFEWASQQQALVRRIYRADRLIDEKLLLQSLQSGHFTQSGRQVTLEMKPEGSRLPVYAMVGERIR